MKWTIEAGDAALINTALLSNHEPAATIDEISTIMRDRVDTRIIARLIILARQADALAERHNQQRAADRVDGFDRDDTGESPDY